MARGREQGRGSAAGKAALFRGPTTPTTMGESDVGVGAPAIQAEQRREGGQAAFPVVRFLNEGPAGEPSRCLRSGSSSSRVTVTTHSEGVEAARRWTPGLARMPSIASGEATTALPMARASRTLFCTPRAIRSGITRPRRRPGGGGRRGLGRRGRRPEAGRAVGRPIDGFRPTRANLDPGRLARISGQASRQNQSAASTLGR